MDDTTSDAAAIRTVDSPFCCELRSKKYYFLKSMPTEESHIKDGSGFCWCRRTMQAIGPDAEKVGPRHCTAGRSCYKSLFET